MAAIVIFCMIAGLMLGVLAASVPYAVPITEKQRVNWGAVKPG